MNNDNAKTVVSPTPYPGTASADSRQANRIQDAAIRIESTSLPILTALVEWRVVDGLVAATSLPTLQRDGRFYASTQPNDATVALDATHVPRSGRTPPQRHVMHRSITANPLSPATPPPPPPRANRCPIRTTPSQTR